MDEVAQALYDVLEEAVSLYGKPGKQERDCGTKPDRQNRQELHGRGAGKQAGRNMCKR